MVVRLKFADGRWNTEESFLFHITTKDQIREIVEDTDGTLLDRMADLPINPAWATCEPGDGGMVKGEEFLMAMFNNWKQMAPKYLQGVYMDKAKEERAITTGTKGGQMTIAVHRNDSAYFERIGGMVSFLVANVDKLKKVKTVDQEHSAILEGLHRWWKANDKRLRSKLWIDGAFKIAIKKYKTDMFWRRSINMCFIFIANNAEHWKDDETFNPDNWFPKKRGKFCNAMFGWKF